MATMITDRMSTELHLHYGKRHVRLAKQTKGAEELVQAMFSPMSALSVKHEAKQKCADDRMANYDDMILYNAFLSDVIRNISDSAKQYDRNNPGRSIYTSLFPDGKTMSITSASLLKTPDMAEQVLQRLKKLGAEHPLFAYADPLSESITRVRSGFKTYQKSITNEKTAIAEEELAQADMRKQYEFNYLDAVKLFGKVFANRLFPKMSSRKKKEEVELQVAE